MNHGVIMRAPLAQGSHDRGPLRACSPHMVNIPRALFTGRTGRQPLYHIAIEELQEWTYAGEPLVPLKGFPGVVWQRSKRKKRLDHDGLF
jgi:hypothetical protein